MYVQFTLIIFYLLIGVNKSDCKYILFINASEFIRSFRNFWDSTGFCPPEPRSNINNYLMTEDVKLNLALISALPNNAITNVRIHWLLDLITIRAMKNDSPVYNFTQLDLFLDYLRLNNLHPGFELMGNPSLYFYNLDDTKQQKQFTYLVEEIATRYINRYGFEYVSKWKFETWNEPDLHEYNILNFTIPAYRHYLSACSDGLHLASARWKDNKKNLKLGGPAGLFKSPDKHPLCWDILSECGKSIATCPFDYISFHKKGDGKPANILNWTLNFINQIRMSFPQLNNTPIANDESDILSNWSKSKRWRADVRYAAMVVQIILDHYHKLVKQMNVTIELLSNDNGFLNYHPYYFTQRTLFARQINNTNPPHIQFIKKPVYVAMALLSYLGTTELNQTVNSDNKIVNFLGTTSFQNNAREYSLIITYVNDTYTNKNAKELLEVFVTNLPKDDYKYVVYTLDNIVTNPYKVWKKWKSPVFPDKVVRDRMRQAEGPYRLVGPKDLLSSATETRDVHLEFMATLPQVVLLHICSNGQRAPGRVTHLRAYNVTYNELILIWSMEKVHTKCIKTYEIQFQPSQQSPYRRINSDDVIFNWYQYVVPFELPEKETNHGSYRIRAVDYWDRFGPYSLSFKYPEN